MFASAFMLKQISFHFIKKSAKTLENYKELWVLKVSVHSEY